MENSSSEKSKSSDLERTKSSENSSSSNSEEEDFVCATRMCFKKLFVGNFCYACYINKNNSSEYNAKKN